MTGPTNFEPWMAFQIASRGVVTMLEMSRLDIGLSLLQSRAMDGGHQTLALELSRCRHRLADVSAKMFTPPADAAPPLSGDITS